MTIFKKGSFEILTNKGKITKNGYVSQNFGIYKQYDEMYGVIYCVIHLPSGWRIVVEDKLGGAKAIVIKLEELDVDWKTITNENVKDHPKFQEMREIAMGL